MGKLIGHVSQVSDIISVKNSSEVISIDRKLLIRIWTLENLQCI